MTAIVVTNKLEILNISNEGPVNLFIKFEFFKV